MTDSQTTSAPGVEDFLARVDEVLATTSGTSAHPPAPAPVPAGSGVPAPDPAGQSVDELYAAVTSGRNARPTDSVPDLTQPTPPEAAEPRPPRTRTVTGRSGRLPDWRTGQTADLSKPAEPSAPRIPEPKAIKFIEAAKAARAAELAKEAEEVEGTTVPEDAPAEPDGDLDGAEGEAPTPQPTGVQIITTTVQEWRPPAGPRGKGWGRAVLYTGSGILLGWLSGFTRGAYITLDRLSVNPDAIGGIAISLALAALMINRSKKTWIALGCALLLVLLVQLMTLPVFAGAVATGFAWGLDQRARHMRPVIAWTARALFAAAVLASFALVWKTVVHLFTGAAL